MIRSSFLALALAGLGLALPPAACGEFSFLGNSLGRWAGGLSSPRAEDRRAAAFAVGKLGQQGALALEKDPYGAGRDDAVKTRDSAVFTLLKPLKEDADARVRGAAATGLGDIAGATNEPTRRGFWKVAREALESALKDPDPGVRRGAAYAIGSVGEPAASAAPLLRAALADDRPDVRQNAAWALGHLGKAAGADGVRELCRLLTDGQDLVRRDAAGALGNLGHEAAASGVRPLVELVKKEKDEVVRRTALDALARMTGPEHRDLAPDFYPLLKDKDADTARSAAFILANMGGEPAARALPALRDALKDPDPRMQALAAAALANVGPEAAPAVMDLGNALDRGRTAEVRRNAALALAHMKDEARPAVDALGRALRLPDGPKTYRPGRPAMEDQVREQAAEALARLRYPANEKAVPDLLAAIGKDPDPVVRQRCIWALFAVGEDARKLGVDKALTRVLDETSDEMLLVRYDAARALAFTLKAEAPDRAADVLLHMLKNQDLRVYNRTDAQVSGGSTETTGREARVKASTGGDARYMAAEALGYLGGKAAGRNDVVEALRKAKGDEDAKLRDKATEALERIGK